MCILYITVTPIIVVPSALSSLITLYNAKDFLLNGSYVSTNDIRSTSHKPSHLVLSRPSYYDSTRAVEWHIIDDVTALKLDRDWDRIAAVFVHGGAWQFDDWPKSRFSSIATIFSVIPAFHLHWSDEPLHANIGKWQTHRLSLNKTKRYADRAVVLEFWNVLMDKIKAKASKFNINI